MGAGPEETTQPRILIIDDEPLIRRLLRDAIIESGYLPLEAASGEAALQMVQASPPDAVLLDIVMPGMDGFATCAALRRLPQGENIPVLMITALENPETISRAYAVGATDYLPKPVNPLLLRHHLRYVLRSSRLIDELRRKDKQLQLAGQVFTHSSEMILIADAGYRIIEVNPAFCRLSGYQRDEVIGSDLRGHKSAHHDNAFFQKLWECVGEHGCWQGELWNRRKDGESFPTLTSINRIADEDGAAVHIVVANDISALREIEQRLNYLSRYDPLTDLPNRALFLDRLQNSLAHAYRNNKRMGVLCFDLDNFHEINESFGHAIGDFLLQEVAKRLVAQVRKSDTVARLGSDVFALLLLDLNKDESVALVAQRLQEELSRPFVVDGRDLDLTVSAGIALFPGDNEEDAAELCKKAEIAMQAAKREGKNRFCFFSSEMNSRARERLELKHDLRRGIDRGELLLYYQPKFDCRSGALTGLEALVRWQHPDRGLIPPLHFIPLAEETGLIVPLGEQVLRLACAQNRQWRERGFAPFRVAVNLSARQFQDDTLVDMVAGVLKESGLPADGLELEITESAFMGDTVLAAETLRRFRAMGIKLALDDFGTGYSSLSYLKRFPVDVLKIDYSFVKNIRINPEDTAIVRAIIAMARSLGLSTVAEGVETEMQRTFLLEQGCDELQGYVAGMPQPATQVERFLPRLTNGV